MLFEVMYRLDAIPIKLSMALFMEIEKAIFK